MFGERGHSPRLDRCLRCGKGLTPAAASALLARAHGVTVEGVVHVGANRGGEVATYRAMGATRIVLANGLAQSQALMCGKTAEQALADQPLPVSAQADATTLASHRSFPGNRPSTTLLLDQLTPRAMGALVALYEHRVFTSGAVWGINSFDQWGVELGKVLAKDIHARLLSGDATGLDASSAALLQRVRLG